MESSLIKRIKFYLKISALFLKGRHARNKEYFKDYDIVSETYDSCWTSKMGKHEEEMLNKLLFPDGFNLLDLACGTGFVITETMHKGRPSNIIGIDGSEGMIAKASKKVSDDRVRFIKGDILEEISKLPDNYFDIVSFGWALSYIDKKNRGILIENIRRVLKPDGCLAVITNRKRTIDNVEKAYLEVMEEHSSNINKISDMGMGLIKDHKELQKMFLEEKLIWYDGWDGEDKILFDNSDDAVSWIRECGALAGTFELMDLDNFWEELSRKINKKNNGEVIITHRFSVGIAKK